MKYYRSHVLVSVDPECVKRGAHEILTPSRMNWLPRVSSMKFRF